MLQTDFKNMIMVVGPFGAGKSSLVKRFCRDVFPDDLIPTIGVALNEKNVILQNKNIALQILDTQGQERCRPVIISYYRRAKGVILCYDITDRPGFNRLEDFMDEISSNVINSTPIIFCGMKSDLNANRTIERTEAENFANKHGIKRYIEVTAKEYSSVEAVFNTMLEAIVHKDKLVENSKTLPVETETKSDSWCSLQ